MLYRIYVVIVVVPLAIVLIALAVANRAPVLFTLDPFEPGNPRLSFELPLFALLMVVLALGLVVGSAITWLKQGRYRRIARERAREPELRAPPPRGTALPGPSA